MTEGETVCPYGCYVATHGDELCPHGFGLAVSECSVQGCTEPNIIGRAELSLGMPALCSSHFETWGMEPPKGEWE